MANGRPEGFLIGARAHANVLGPSTSASGSAVLDPLPQTRRAVSESETVPCRSEDEITVPIARNGKLLDYLKANPGFQILQHGCHHDYLEFDSPDRQEICRRLDQGSRFLQDAGFPRPRTFVAPYDKLSRQSLHEVAARFRVLSTGWFELRRLPYSWWPRYGVKKLRKSAHWRVGNTLLLSHPGCLLSCHHAFSTMLGGIFHYLESQRLTILVTHWWEYFREGQPDEPFIDLLHETAGYLATHPHVKVTTFDALVDGQVPLN